LYSLSLWAKPPRWINDVSKVCKKSELCAVGEGESLSFAKRNARLALAKIFSTKIQTKFAQEVASYGGHISEQTSDKITESTDEILEGVEIRKSYNGKLYVYALAVLNKHKAARLLAQKIQQIDKRLKVFVQDNSASAAAKMQELFVQREALNRRYMFLTGMGIKSPISFEQVYKAKQKNMSNLIIHVYVDEQVPKLLESQIAQFLSKQGYRITTGRNLNKSATHILTGSVKAEKQYMKVDGFKKYKFQVELSSSNRKRVELGHVVFSDIETGRSYQQAYEKAIPILLKGLSDNINKLNFD
jgi:hypothetical protein